MCLTHILGYLLSDSNCRSRELSAIPSLSDEENGPGVKGWCQAGPVLPSAASQMLSLVPCW